MPAFTLICLCFGGSCLVAASLGGAARAQSPAPETIVLLRHGEKPEQGLGQLSCQGLNRALALGGVLQRMFGHPDAIFAPNPAARKADHGVVYDYVRPLATIEPAAVAFGLPVNASIGVDDLPSLQHALTAPALAGKLVVVAWEHKAIAALARQLLAEYGGRTKDVPDWNKQDFDSLYVVRIVRGGTHDEAEFERLREGLDGRPASCPGASPP